MIKKKVTKKSPKKASKVAENIDTSAKILRKRNIKATKLLIYSTIAFIISLVLYLANPNGNLSWIFKLISVLSFSLVLLGLVVELILYLLIKKNKK